MQADRAADAECHSAAIRARGVVTAAYGVSGEELVPLVCPRSCPWAEGSAKPCHIRVNHWRDRKTGPCYPVQVLECEAHGHAFTLYPLGHFPYGRAAVAPVSGEGELLRVTEGAAGDAAAATEARGAATDGAGAPPARRTDMVELAWDTTLFQAAVDAAGEQLWPAKLKRGVMGPTMETQERHLALCAQVLGLDATLPARVGEGVAQQLEIPRLVHLEAARRYDEVRGRRDRARVIVSVLRRLPRDRRLLGRLLHCGALMGVWGRVRRWHRAGVDLFPLGDTGFG